MIDPLTHLWLPRDHWERQVLRRRSGGLVYLGWGDVTGTPLSYERLVELASSMRTETLLIAISIINIITTNTPSQIGLIRQLHISLAQQFCEPKVARRIELLLQSGRGDAVAHQEQLLLAARLALLHGQPGPSEGTSLEPIGEFLLGINDLFKYHQWDAPSEESTSQELTPQELMTRLASRRQAIISSGQLRYQLARYFDLLVTRSRKKCRKNCDLDAAFVRQTNISLEEYMACGLLYLEPFFGATSVRDLSEKNFLHRVRLLEEHVRDPQLLEYCRRLFVQDTEAFRAIWSETGDQPIERLSFVPFQRHPLVRLSNGSAIPIDQSFLLDKLSVGAYWLLHESFRATDTKNGVPTFTRYIGDLFQDYVTDLLTRIYTNAQPEIFFDEETILQSSPQMQRAIKRGRKPQCCDGILVSRNSLVLFEMTITSLPVQTLIEADPSAFFNDVSRKFQHKMEQLAHTFDGLAQQMIELPGLNKDAITHVYPVLVLLQSFPQHLVSWDHLGTFGKAPGRYDFGNTGSKVSVHAPQILTAEELEILEPLICNGSFSLPDLLAQKMSSGATASMCMKNYLFPEKQVTEQSNQHMLELYEVAVHRLREILENAINFAENPERMI